MLVNGLLSCPGCGGRLGGHGHAVRRRVFRRCRVPVSVWPRRARCSSCGVTHVLLPAWLLSRRCDSAAVIGEMLARAALGQTAKDGLLILVFIYSAALVIAEVAGGVISDRSGRRRLPILVSGLVMAIPAVMLALWPSWPVAIASAIILGLGFGVYLSVGPGAGNPGAAVSGGARQGSRRHQRRHRRTASAWPGDRRPADHQARRIPGAIPVCRRNHRAGLGVRMEDPLSAVTIRLPPGSPHAPIPNHTEVEPVRGAVGTRTGGALEGGLHRNHARRGREQ
jgi:Domain of unknown function (DUF6431)